jgi:Leucine-rich repeat (LRR) protein
MLRKLKNLTTLTVHGNPVETIPGFRSFILSKLPKLKHLNFSGLSKKDLQNAIIYVKSNKVSLKAHVDGDKDKEKKSNDSDEDD